MCPVTFFNEQNVFDASIESSNIETLRATAPSPGSTLSNVGGEFWRTDIVAVAVPHPRDHVLLEGGACVELMRCFFPPLFVPLPRTYPTSALRGFLSPNHNQDIRQPTPFIPLDRLLLYPRWTRTSPALSCPDHEVRQWEAVGAARVPSLPRNLETRLERPPRVASITSSFKSFASNLIRSKPTPAPTPVPIAAAGSPPPSIPRFITPPPQGSGPQTIRLIPSPGPNQLPRSRSAADILEGVAVPAPAFKKIANELAEAEKLLNEEDVDQVSFGFGAAGYEDHSAHDVSMASVSLPFVTEQHEENKPEEPFNKRTSFVFGSPQHSVTNAEFGDAAAAVLREMNARMGVANTSQALNIQQLQEVMSNVGKPVSPIKTEGKSDVRFASSHDKEFAKMDSIANHFSVRSRKRKSEHTADVGDTTSDSKVFVMHPRLSDAADADDSERIVKRARISTADDKPTAGGKTAKDSAAIRAQLESRRKSARTSAGVSSRKSAGATQQTAKGGFGLMKMVRGIWGSKEKEKEKEKPKEQPKDKENERPVSEVLKNFPSVPTENPLPNFPVAPKDRIVSGGKQSVGPSKIAPKARGQELGPTRSFPIAPKPRATSGLYAPTAASLARHATTSSSATRLTSATGRSRGLAAVTAPAKPVITKATLVPTARLPSPPTTEPVGSGPTRLGANTPKPGAIPSRPASRALPVPPATVGRAATSGSTIQGSTRVVSPTMRRAATTGRATSPPNGRKPAVNDGRDDHAGKCAHRPAFPTKQCSDPAPANHQTKHHL
ncbi:hypothetical protein AG1IA_09586 [Rhizoctonia solani AG-1 IA]|uniref:Uncharacterized protein n=1 Tax=Thanatephorus cucumeris (strain AG1-IA) TaxID=983506 RepID=L8WJ52_THACA|nr:hypothetical protein AG1IA_09586 [Rhizoctonia solani AG-1 IA]